MSSEENFHDFLLDIKEEIELRIKKDRTEGFDMVLIKFFAHTNQKEHVLDFSEAQKEALLRMTHTLLVIGEYSDELHKQTPDQDPDMLFDELYEYCYSDLILPQEVVLDAVEEIVDALFAE